MQDPELIEAVLSAHRERTTSGKILESPAWHDLDDAGRSAAHAACARLRLMEAALDGGGLSSTARSVLNRIQR